MTTRISNTNLTQVIAVFRKSYPKAEVSNAQLVQVANFLALDEEGYTNTTEAAEAAAYEFNLDYIEGAQYVTPEWVYDLTSLILSDEPD